MSRDGSVTFTWGDGEHTFKLAIGQVRELEEKRDAGIRLILQRVTNKSWYVDDLRETLRLGLIGGGMSPVAALKLVQRYFDERPLLESEKPAFSVLYEAMAGFEDEPLGKPAAAKAPDLSAESSPSPPSTEPAPPSDSDPAK